MFKIRGSWDKNIALGDEARDRGDWLAASVAYEAAVSSEPKSPRSGPIFVQLGHALKELKQFDAAAIAYKNALATMANDSDLQLQIGHLEKLTGKTAAALESYARALELDPNNIAARRELLAQGVDVPTLEPTVFKDAKEENATSFFAIELTDLIDYLQHSAVPSGIQRVQMELARAVLNDKNIKAQFCYFNREINYWVELSSMAAKQLFQGGKELSDDARVSLAHTVRSELENSAPISFRKDAILFNPGASWSISNYFLAVREAKLKADIRCCTFVHDCIPLLFPELCTDSVVENYVSWIPEVLSVSDVIIANSENTKRDVLKVALELALPEPTVIAVPLNGNFRRDVLQSLRSPRVLSPKLETLAELLGFGGQEPFVLLVSTVEPRKNHLAAFAAWTKLIKEGSTSVPFLVCVGARGWHNREIYDHLERNKVLQERVIMCDRVSDYDLHRLYESCLFTLYPSLYEGWGLPVSESIGYGKVPLAANISSIPEAGGSNAVYFEPQATDDLARKARELIDNEARRLGLERDILENPNIREWSAISTDMLNACATPDLRKGPSRVAAILEAGKQYSMQRSHARSLSELMGGRFDIRASLNWWPQEDWGCWTKHPVATIRFVPSADEYAVSSNGRMTLFIRLVGSPNVDNNVQIAARQHGARQELRVDRGATKWVAVALEKVHSSVAVELMIRSKIKDDFAAATQGQDTRVVGVGVVSVFAFWHDDTPGRLDFLQRLVLESLSS